MNNGEFHSFIVVGLEGPLAARSASGNGAVPPWRVESRARLRRRVVESLITVSPWACTDFSAQSFFVT